MLGKKVNKSLVMTKITFVFLPNYEKMFDAWDNVLTTNKMFNNL
jgi:hypothetical protein